MSCNMGVVAQAILEVDTKNESAIRLYEFAGYEKISTRANYYGLGVDAFGYAAFKLDGGAGHAGYGNVQINDQGEPQRALATQSVLRLNCATGSAPCGAGHAPAWPARPQC